MKFDPTQYPHGELTDEIIGAAMAIHRELGPGLDEKIYENYLTHSARWGWLNAYSTRAGPFMPARKFLISRIDPLGVLLFLKYHAFF